MRYYLAPLEGITTYVYRNAYHKHFRQMDKYFTPFIVPHKDKRFNTRELKELSPEHNEGLFVVPQLLTNNAEDFIKTANDIASMGYGEINLNFGCPSKTVVTKKKGSGFLAYPDELERFLDDIFTKIDIKISVKTRIGMESPDEFYRLLEIYNKYPLEELIIHPRIQTDYYNNTPNLDIFEVAYKESENHICYNGDIHTKQNFVALYKRFPELKQVMLGRGIIKNPGLASTIENDEIVSKDALMNFHQMILEEYIKISSGDRNVLFKMKELWFFMITMFENGEKWAKKIKKAEKLKDYERIVQALFASCNLSEDAND